MARRPTLLIVSLLANFSLGGALLWLQKHNSHSEAPHARSAAVSTTEETVPTSEVWSQTSSRPNDPGYADGLRQLGFPERVVRSIVRYRIEEDYLPEVRKLRSAEQRPYWQRGRYSEEMSEAGRARMRAIMYETDGRARNILGPAADTALPGDYGEGELRRYGNLSPQKISALQAIRRDYSHLSNEVRESSQGILFPEDREKLAFLTSEERADMARLLTPDELDQYDRRNSATAYETRNELEYLDGTSEQEFLNVYRLRSDFDRRYGIGNLTPPQEKAREAAQSELQAQIRAALGPERYAEYQLVNDKNFRATHDFVIENGLSPTLAKTLVALQRECIRRSTSDRGDASLNGEQEAAQLQSLADSARETLRASIGDEQLAKYQRSPAGSWLTKLASSGDHGRR